jgi:hypothetical protein
MAEALAERERAFALEQSVRGLDSAVEPTLHGWLAAPLSAAREVYYPSASGERRRRPRCDLVLGEHPGALWIEVKVLHQLRPGYGARFRALLADLRKLRRDPRIERGAAAAILFHESAEILERDLLGFEACLSRAELLAGFRAVSSFVISDRLGHRLCTVAVWPIV